MEPISDMIQEYRRYGLEGCVSTRLGRRNSLAKRRIDSDDRVARQRNQALCSLVLRKRLYATDWSEFGMVPRIGATVDDVADRIADRLAPFPERKCFPGG